MVACPCERPSIGRRVWQEKARNAIPEGRVYSLRAYASRKFTRKDTTASQEPSTSRPEAGDQVQPEGVNKAEQRPQTMAVFRLIGPSDGSWDGFETQCLRFTQDSLKRSRGQRRVGQVMRYDAVWRKARQHSVC